MVLFAVGSRGQRDPSDQLEQLQWEIIERYRYDAFGTPTIYAPNWTQRQTSFYNNRFLFTGREYLGAWIYEYRARVYHAGLGRFMSEDPKLFDAGDYNLFRYCHNDPIDFTDPMGTQDERREPPYNHQEQAKAVGITIAERISLWQKSMESSIGGEHAFQMELSMQIPVSYHGEGSLSNLQKRTDMANIAAARVGSHEYDRAADKDDFAPGTYRCNKFDYDIERTARVTPIMVRDSDTGRMWPATAGERATQFFEGWRRVSRNERQAGDEAAYVQQTRNASGHTGIVISDGHGGLTNVSAHERGVYPLPGQFEKNSGTVYLRYIGE
jgi:RHS repeat-associated protein